MGNHKIGKRIINTLGAIIGTFAMGIPVNGSNKQSIDDLAMQEYRNLRTAVSNSLFEQNNENAITTVFENGHYAIVDQGTGKYTFHGTILEYLSLGLAPCQGSLIMTSMPIEDLGSVLDITAFQSETNGMPGHNYVIIQQHDKNITTSLIVVNGNTVLRYNELANQVNLSCANPFADAILVQKRLEKDSFPGASYRSFDCCGNEIILNWGIQDGKLIIHELKGGKSTYMSIDYEIQTISIIAPDRTGREIGYFDMNADGKLDAVVENDGNNAMVVRTQCDFATITQTLGANCTVITTRNPNSFLWKIRKDDYSNISGCLSNLVNGKLPYQQTSTCNCSTR